MPKGAMFLITSFTLALLGGAATADELETDAQKLSYILGYQFGQNMQQQGIELDKQAFILAFDDALQQTPSRLSPEQMKAAMSTIQQQEQQKRTESGKKNKATGKDFLKTNKEKEGVVELPNGLQYRILEQGEGKKPAADDTVVVNYRGTLVDGTVFDSSYERGEPVTFKVNGVIKGWQQALQLMPVGSKWKVFIPSELAYGKRGAGRLIGPNEILIFDIELLEIK